jgi:hypothetical protein
MGFLLVGVQAEADPIRCCRLPSNFFRKVGIIRLRPRRLESGFLSGSVQAKSPDLATAAA